MNPPTPSELQTMEAREKAAAILTTHLGLSAAEARVNVAELTAGELEKIAATLGRTSVYAVQTIVDVLIEARCRVVTNRVRTELRESLRFATRHALAAHRAAFPPKPS